jgi:hypothetical protein
MHGSRTVWCTRVQTCKILVVYIKSSLQIAFSISSASAEQRRQRLRLLVRLGPVARGRICFVLIEGQIFRLTSWHIIDPVSTEIFLALSISSDNWMEGLGWFRCVRN